MLPVSIRLSAPMVMPESDTAVALAMLPASSDAAGKRLKRLLML